jgi:hypothetical protein
MTTVITDPGIFDTLFKLPDFVENSEKCSQYILPCRKKISHLVSLWTCILRNWRFQIFLWEAVDLRITK